MRIVFFSLLFVFTSALIAQTETRMEQLDRYLDLLETHDKLWGSLAFMEGDEITYQRTFGSAGPEQKTDENTQYRIGSVTKTFTATLIFQLIEEGKLTLDTPLATFFPDFPSARDITVAHLLGHRSGLASLTDHSEFLAIMYTPQTKKELLRLMRKMDPVFSPGDKADYSNTNYLLLGYIVEELTGSSYVEAVTERITKPLGLKRTAYGKPASAAENSARSYAMEEGQFVVQAESDMSIPQGAGGLVSTPTELNHFIKALFDGKLIDASSLATMKDIRDGYGMGLFSFPLNDKIAYGHQGSIDQFQSNLAYFPKEDVAFAFISNAQNGNLNDFLIGMLSIWFDLPFEMPDFSAEPVELSTEELRAGVGDFDSSDLPLKISFRLEDGQLTAQATGQGAFPLTAYGPDDFRFAAAGIEIKFSGKDENGRFERFELHQGGGTFSFSRIKQ